MSLKYRITHLYLNILPFYLLIDIIFSTFRTTIGLEYASYSLGIMQGFDILLFSCFLGYIAASKEFVTVLILLIPAFSVGMLNNELDRHFLTDISNPLLFFAKCVLFSVYWKKFSFQNFYIRFIKYAFYGSLICLPLVYYFFRLAGISRLAIFPPMELPFTVFGANNQYFLVIVSLIVIFMYGKRAQFVSVLVGLLFLLKKVSLGKKILVIFFCVLVGFVLMKYFENNLAIQRLVFTIDKLSEAPSENLDLVAAGRFSEIDVVLDNMNGMDYFWGKGCAIHFQLADKVISNVHLTPLSLIMKYGMFFMLFTYGYIFCVLSRCLSRKHECKIASITVVIFAIESFFSYALFVTPLLPVVIGYLRSVRLSYR